MEKLNGKELNGNPQPAASGAESRAAKKFAELEAGRILVAQAAKRAEESREQLEEERLEKREKKTEKEREYRDTPELSRQSRWFGVEGKQLEENFRWTLEMEQELWEAFQSWQPKPGGSLSGDLSRLSQMYLALLEAVLIYTIGEEQTEELARLDEVLMEKLNLLLETRLKNLTLLFLQTGGREPLRRIWNSLYKQTAGATPNPGRADSFFRRHPLGAGLEAWKAGSGAMGTDVFTGSIPKAVSMEEGRLYRPSGRGGVEMNQAFDLQNRSGKLQLSQRAFVLNGGNAQGEGSFSRQVQELCRAEAFAAHLSESRELFGELQKGGGNEEAAGYFAALTFLKGQIYASGGGMWEEKNLPMESLIHRMVDYYLSSKGARQVYYYTVDLYQRTGDFQKAARDGLSYSYRMFQEKKEEAGGESKSGYSRNAGFFQMLNGRALEEDFRVGVRLLEDNFRSFLQSQGEEKGAFSLRAQRISAWGMLAEGEKRRAEQEQKIDKSLLRAVLIAAAAVLLFWGWKLFLG